MFGEPGDRVAQLVGEPRLLGHFAEDLRRGLLGFACAHQIENAEFHRIVLREGVALDSGLTNRRLQKGRASRLALRLRTGTVPQNRVSSTGIPSQYWPIIS